MHFTSCESNSRLPQLFLSKLATDRCWLLFTLNVGSPKKCFFMKQKVFRLETHVDQITCLVRLYVTTLDRLGGVEIPYRYFPLQGRNRRGTKHVFQRFFTRCVERKIFIFDLLCVRTECALKRLGLGLLTIFEIDGVRF